jgi:hypothetical protein
MNENSTNNPSTSAPHHGLTAEAISRRAYEIWEHEGRPESRDLHHWLRAEQELLAEQGKPSERGAKANAGAGNTDTQPLQGTRAAAAANREPRTPPKRSSAAPFSTDRGNSNRATQTGMRSGPGGRG